MKVKALTSFFSSGRKGLEEGKEYEIEESIAKTFIARGLVEEVEVKKQEVKKSK